MVEDIDINTFSMTSVFSLPGGKNLNPTRAPKKDITSNPVSPWGRDNAEPNFILQDIAQTPVLGAALRFKSQMLYGKGCYLASVVDIDTDGNEVLKPIKDEAIQKFLDRSHFQTQIMKQCLQNYVFEFDIPEFITTKNRKEVYMINILKNAYCRWAKKNDDGEINKLFVHGDWRKNGLKQGTAIAIPTLSEYFPVESLRESGSYKNIFRYLDISADDKEYYPEPVWNSIRTSDWLAVAQRIPSFKLNIFDNQVSIKYHIETTKEWWMWKYPDFETIKPEDRIKLMKKEREMFEKTMTGTDGAGKSIWSTGHIDRASGNYIPGWKITKLDSKFGSGDYIEDAQEATAQVFLALQMSPTLIGQSPGKKFGAGSGSDIREAFNVHIQMQQMYRDRILQPWYTAFKYNGYPSDIRLAFKYPTITTLDKGTETQTVQ